MDIIDAQVHVFHRYTETETLAAMDALGISGVLIDELWTLGSDGTTTPRKVFPNGAQRPLTPLSQAAALQYPDRFSLLQRVSRADPDPAALLAILSATPGFRAMRIDGRETAEQEALMAGGYDDLLRLARDHDLPVFLLMVGPMVFRITYEVCHRFPGVQFVLDHCGRPASLEQWNEILALQTCSNLLMKWCHPHHYFDAGPYPFTGLRTQMARAIEAFGVQRIMWASDITVDRAGVPWADLLYTIREDPALSASDKEWLLGRTARALLKWDVAGGVDATRP